MSYQDAHPHPYNMGLGTITPTPQVMQNVSETVEVANAQVRKSPPWLLPALGLLLLLTAGPKLRGRR